MNTSPDIAVRGIGWLDDAAYGAVCRHEQVRYGAAPDAPPPWRRPELWGYPARNLWRFDALTRMTCTACALALWDAGETTTAGAKRNFGLLGTNAAGSLAANRAYFQDYVAAGRTSGRGNLFIYTLPTSPLAEASIHFGLQGPLVYMGFPKQELQQLLTSGAQLIAAQALPGLLVVRAEAGEAVSLLLAPAPAGAGTLAPFLRLCAEPQRVRDLAARWAQMAGAKAST